VQALSNAGIGAQTKRPWGQNVRGDKASVMTKRPWGQNVRRTKRPWGQNIRGQNVRLGHIYQGLARQYLLLRNLLSVKEKSAKTHSLSVGGWGETYTILKGTLARDFRHLFFHQKQAPGPMIRP
jgi:hypothetical protein